MPASSEGDAIEAGLCREVAAGIERRQARAAEFSGNQPVSAPVAAGAAGDADSGRSALASRFRSFTSGYNLMFIVTMLAILALVMGGLRTIELVAWSRRNVVTGKVLMGMLFIGMAVLVIFL